MKALLRYCSVVAVLTFLMVGCVTKPDCPGGMREALEMVRNGSAACVLVQYGKIVAVENGRGIAPLLDMYEKNPDAMKGGIVVDKVIGRAAAFIALHGGARQVHGELMSEGAILLLAGNGVIVSANKIVPEILNRKQDGLCPMEQTVRNLTDPAEAVAALKSKVAELSAQNSTN